MKVLLLNSRPNSLKAWGGDTTQLVETQKCLLTLGVEAEVKEDYKSLSKYDLIHIFNMQTADNALQILQQCQAAQKKIALSTIYWDFRFTIIPENLQYGPGAFWRKAAFVAPRLAAQAHRLKSLRGQRRIESMQRILLEQSHLLLPNSIAELEILIAKFGLPSARSKSVIVPNGVSISNEIDSPEIPAELKNIPTPFALMAGSFHPIKGQDRFIRALHDHPEIPVVCIGHSRKGKYGEYCGRLAQARGNTFLLDPVPQKAMGAIFKRAKIHVLPSLRESPGLSSLEAAVFGANCVVGIHAPVQEYFGEEAFVCDPLNLSDLKAKILEAWNSPYCPALRERILNEFTWRSAAEATIKGYKKVLCS